MSDRSHKGGRCLFVDPHLGVDGLSGSSLSHLLLSDALCFLMKHLYAGVTLCVRVCVSACCACVWEGGRNILLFCVALSLQSTLCCFLYEIKMIGWLID